MSTHKKRIQNCGIIFDMDNTLLQSKIDFKAMRADILNVLLDQQVGTEEQFLQHITPAQVIEKGKKLCKEQRLDTDECDRIEQAMWEQVKKHETIGMHQVKLEEGVSEGLEQLKQGGYVLTIVTNNAHEAACTALKETNIISYFDLIVGRDQMEELKPSPSGVEYIINAWKNKTEDGQPSHWVMLGDSWIDGYAAQQAGVNFVAYKGNLQLMREQGVEPLANMTHFDQFIHWMETYGRGLE